MARVKIEAVETLDTLIPDYAEHKAELDKYKKLSDAENKKIKELMVDNVYIVGGYKATKSIATKESINEEKLLDVLKQYDISYGAGIIKTKEYVDMDALESAIYRGDVDKDILMEIDKCRESKETITLRVTAIKK